MDFVQILADFVCKAEFEDIPTECIERAKECFLDLIGVTVSGSKHPVSDLIIDKYITRYYSNQEATIIGKGKKTSLPTAAFINSTMGHILDFDDIKAYIGHPSVTIIPAILSTGEYLCSSGKDALTACVLGNEISSKIAKWLGSNQSINGWHPTCTSGIFGVTAAVAKLIGLNNQALCNAFSIATSLASGLLRNSGTFTKAVQVGKTSEKGINAALFGEIGITANPLIFIGEKGFFNIFSNDNIEIIFGDIASLGKPFEIMDTGFKCYPSCASTHTAIDAILLLQKERPIPTESINKIRVGTVPINIDNLPYSLPKNPTEARFSMQFCLAVTLLEEKLLPEHFTEKLIDDYNVKQLMSKISMYHHPDLEPLGYRGTENSIVEIEFNDGSKRFSRVDIPRGNPRNPMSKDELIKKYKNCTTDILTEINQRQSINIILELEYESNLKYLMNLISGGKL